MKKTLSLIFVFLFAVSLQAKDFSISGSFGAALPMGRFRDNSDIYSGCGKDPFSRNTKVKITDTAMSAGYQYGFALGYDFGKNFNVNVAAGGSSNKFDGIEVATFTGDFNNPNETKKVNPYFSSVNLSLGLDYTFLRFGSLSFKAGIAPQISFITYNTFAIAYNIPIVNILEREENKSTFGFTASIGAEYAIIKDLSVGLNIKYNRLNFDYSSEALSAAFTCFPLDNYYANPQWLMIGLNVKYKIF